MSPGHSTNCASAATRAFVLAGVVLAACQDPARAPTPLTVTSNPPAQLEMIPELGQRESPFVKMYAPGQSYRPNHFIFDISRARTAAATVWKADPWLLIDTIPCGVPQGVYTAVELSSTACLSLSPSGGVIRNGIDTLVRSINVWQNGTFRLAPGGKWAVLLTDLYPRKFFWPVSWPVFNQAGAIAYTIDTLFHITGAAFSPMGDKVCGLWRALGLHVRLAVDTSNTIPTLPEHRRHAQLGAS